MAEDWGSWFSQQQIDWQSSNLSWSGLLPISEKHYTAPTIANPDMISAKDKSSAYQQPLETAHPCVGQAKEPHNWFSGWPQFQLAFAPALKDSFKGKFSTAPCNNSKESNLPMLKSACGQKRFLVFDQLGDQTTLIFGSDMAIPVGYFTSLRTNTTGTCFLKTGDPITKDNVNVHLGAIPTTEQYAKDPRADLSSEMHEDTDELNALLYSEDDSDCGEDDEVNSTGHSPSTMTVHNKQSWFEGGVEGVGSSNGSVKKRKLAEENTDFAALKDTASSVKRTSGFELEDDAESKCENKRSWASIDTIAEHNCKKMRMDKIRETVSILQNIIPRGKGKDAVEVIDEAINYLKSLKLKAKALGLDAP